MGNKKDFLKVVAIFLVTILIIILIARGLYKARPRQYEYYSDPVQTFANKEMFILKDKYYVYPKYYYEIEGVVVSKNYQFIDSVANISPVDLAIVWGNVPSNKNLSNTIFSQYGRFASFRIPNMNNVDVDLEYMSSHFSNNHIIPANMNVLMKIPLVNEGDVVKIKGYLVETYRVSDNGKWGTSESRYDSGDGACEVIYTTSLEIK